MDVDFYLPSGEKLGAYRTFLHTGYSTPDPDNPTCATGTGRFCIAFGRLTEYLHFAGRLIKTEAKAFQPNFVEWTQQDRLGSAVTHLPYGDERTATANDRLKFATCRISSTAIAASSIAPTGVDAGNSNAGTRQLFATALYTELGPGTLGHHDRLRIPFSENTVQVSLGRR